MLSSEERDEAKKQLSSVMEESHKHRAELSRTNSLLLSARQVATVDSYVEPVTKFIKIQTLYFSYY